MVVLGILVSILSVLAIGLGLLYRQSRRDVRAMTRRLQDHHGDTRLRQRHHENLLRLDVWIRQLMMSAGREDRFYAMAAAGLLDLLDADAAIVPLFEEGADTFILAANAGAGQKSLDAGPHPLTNGTAFEWVAKHVQVLSIEDLAASRLRVPTALHSLGLRRALIAPIDPQDSVVGTLVALRNDRPFDEIDRQTLVVYAQKVSIAVANMRLLADLESEKERAEVTLHSIGDGVITTDRDGRVEYMNPIAEQLTGWASLEAVGLPIDEIFQVLNEATGESVLSPATRCLRDGCAPSTAAQSLLIRRDGKEFAVDDSAAPIRNRDNQIVGSVLVFHDTSKQRAMARQLSWQATHDALTGLANRRRFEEHVRQAMSTARDSGGSHVLMFLDLDQFKVVNDTCGHMAGDELLKQLASLLAGQVRDADTLARLGGDEFGVLLIGCPVDAGMRIAESIRETVRGFRFVWQSTIFELGASVGVVPICPESQSLASLLSAADVACYMAKEKGRNRVHLYQQQDRALAERHGEMQWVSRITSALQDDRFVLHAQSIIPSGGTDDLFAHLEILVRMIDEDGNIVPPGAFIPAAERYNLMGEIDRWVVRNVFKRYDGRLSSPVPGSAPMCAINLSGLSMGDETLLEFIREQFRTYDVPPECICFEITETAAVQNLSVASRFIRELQAIGCQFALDDFGSGLSSFAYLKNLPVDFLKIDGGFVKDMRHNAMNRAIVEACNQIGRALGIRTIAEFVEDDATRIALHEIGVDYCQGWGIHKPSPLDEVLGPKKPLKAVA